MLARLVELSRRLRPGRGRVAAEVAPPAGAPNGSPAGLGLAEERPADASATDPESNVVPMTFEDR